jgi:hypothetical protein
MQIRFGFLALAKSADIPQPKFTRLEILFALDLTPFWVSNFGWHPFLDVEILVKKIRQNLKYILGELAPI